MINQKSSAVAKYILHRHKKHNSDIDRHKLNTLVYVCHGFMLGTFCTALLTEKIQAWSIGPVVSSVHALVIKHKDDNVVEIEADTVILSESELSLMNKVIDNYARYDTQRLVQATRNSRTPWDITWNFYKNRRCEPVDLIISNDLIQHFYSELMTKRVHLSL